MEGEETPSDAVAVIGSDNLGTKKTVVEVRRPSSYPETTSMQKSGAIVTAATKSRGVSFSGFTVKGLLLLYEQFFIVLAFFELMNCQLSSCSMSKNVVQGFITSH